MVFQASLSAVVKMRAASRSNTPSAWLWRNWSISTPPSQAGARQVSQSSAPALEPVDDGRLCVLAGLRASLVFPILKDLNNITNFPKPISHPAAIAGVIRNAL